MIEDTALQKVRSGRRAALSLARSVAAFAGGRAVLALIYIVAGAVFESAGLILLIPLLGLVIGGDSGGGGMLHRFMNGGFAAAGVTTPFGRLALLIAGFAAVMAIRGVVLVLRDSTMMGLQIGFTEHLRGRVAASLANAGWDRVQRLRHARVMNVMSNDIQRISMASNYLLQCAIASVILLAQCVLAFALSPGLALLSFALLIVSALAMIPMLRRARAQGQYVGAAHLTLIDTVSQYLSGLKLALSQNLQGSFVTEFQETLRNLTDRQLEYVRKQSVTRNALLTLSAMVGAVVVLAGYGFLHLEAAVLITFLLVIARMTGPATQVQQGFQQLALGLPAYETITDLMADLRATTPPLSVEPRQVPDGPLVFEDVTFQHPHTDETGSHGVRQANLTVESGVFLGISGISGSGKTTLADLIAGLVMPQTGRITIGGQPLDNTLLANWRARLSYISQDSFLFHDSIRRNLLWARPEASEAEIWDALTLAGADEIVRRIDRGLDAVVGERGSLVSGGERQRIALARALLRRPRLLIMDEATNAIDITGERALLERLSAVRPRPTIVMVAHRAESLALCDRVVHVENGELSDDAPQPKG